MDHINSSIYICSKKGYEKQVSWIASRGQEERCAMRMPESAGSIQEKRR